MKEVIKDYTYFKLIEAKTPEWKSDHTTVSEWEIDRFYNM